MRPRFACVGLLALLVATSTGTAGAPAALPAPPAPPTTGFGAEPSPAPELERATLANPVLPSDTVTWLRPQVAADAPPLPLVVFLHGFGAKGPAPYLAWLEHLARRGAIVVYPTYPTIDARAKHSRYDTMWAGFEAALADVRARPGARVDDTRLGVVGHSFGGGAAPAIAARAAARGLGRAALFVACFAPWYDLDRTAWSSLPAHALLLTVVFADDAICDPAIGAAFPTRATTIPPGRKALRVYRSDDHGRPALVADHLTPLTVAGLDTLDVHGTWRVVDALGVAAASGATDALAVALGGDDAALTLGAWSDGQPVAPALSAWASPVDGRGSAMWKPGGRQEDVMRRLLRGEAWSTLPLPDPATVAPAGLPAAERFVDDPLLPAALPAAIEAARAKGPVLVLDEVDAPLPGEDRLVAAGIAVVRTKDPARDAPASVRGAAAMLLDRHGRPLLWRPADDPHLVGAVLRLVAPAR